MKIREEFEGEDGKERAEGGPHTQHEEQSEECCCLLLRFSGIQRERVGDPRRPQKAYGAANQERGRHEDLGSCPVRDRKLGLPVRSHAGEISYFLSGELRSAA